MQKPVQSHQVHLVNPHNDQWDKNNGYTLHEKKSLYSNHLPGLFNYFFLLILKILKLKSDA